MPKIPLDDNGRTARMQERLEVPALTSKGWQRIAKFVSCNGAEIAEAPTLAAAHKAICERGGGVKGRKWLAAVLQVVRSRRGLVAGLAVDAISENQVQIRAGGTPASARKTLAGAAQ